jgi:hypothetical protein
MQFKFNSKTYKAQKDVITTNEFLQEILTPGVYTYVLTDGVSSAILNTKIDVAILLNSRVLFMDTLTLTEIERNDYAAALDVIKKFNSQFASM